MWQTMRLSRNPPARFIARQSLEHLEHAVLVEAPAPKVGLGVRAKLELPALLSGGRVDPRGRQPLEMIAALIRADDVDRLVAAIESILDEGKEHTIFLVVAVEERADVPGLAELRPSEGDGCGPHDRALSCGAP
jgi:hypothetical protein